MDFKELVLKNKETILKDIIAGTGMDGIRELNVTGYRDEPYRGLRCELSSNYLDKSLCGVMANNFTEVIAVFGVVWVERENTVYVSGDLRYHHREGGSNGTCIMNKEGSRSLSLVYKIVEDTLVSEIKEFRKGAIKIVVSSDEVSDKVQIKHDEQYAEWALVDILKDMIKSKISIKDVKFYIFDDNGFIEHKPCESLYALVKDVVYKKKYDTLRRY